MSQDSLGGIFILFCDQMNNQKAKTQFSLASLDHNFLSQSLKTLISKIKVAALKTGLWISSPIYTVDGCYVWFEIKYYLTIGPFL
jgi:hydroxymethylpyrimidine/phosphomethylpyrimidine kinase